MCCIIIPSLPSDIIILLETEKKEKRLISAEGEKLLQSEGCTWSLPCDPGKTAHGDNKYFEKTLCASSAGSLMCIVWQLRK